MKLEAGSSCHTQANSKFKQTGFFFQGLTLRSPSWALHWAQRKFSKNPQAKLSKCLRVSGCGGTGGSPAGRRRPSPSPCWDGGEAPWHLGTGTANPSLPPFQNAPKPPKRIKHEGLEQGCSPEMAPGIPIFPPSEVKGASGSPKERRELQDVPLQGTLFGFSGAADHLPSDTHVFFRHRWILASVKALGSGEGLPHPAKQNLLLGDRWPPTPDHHFCASACSPEVTFPRSCLLTSHLRSWRTQSARWVTALSWLCGHL